MEPQAQKRIKDLTGVRSGKLVALERTDQKRKGTTLWKCQCDCGKIILTEGYKIAGEKIKSCGCSRKGHGIKDLTGMKFGNLTAVQRLEEKKDSCYLWICRCDCGKEVKVNTNSLLHGRTKSCGCQKIQALKRRAQNLSGQQFGRLLAIRPLDERMAGNVVWLCQCECGNEVHVPHNSLVTGNTKSCGCLLKEHESPGKYMHYIHGTCVEMLENKSLRKDNTSGYTGVMAYRGKWKAVITFQQKRYDLGTYAQIEDAVKIRKLAEEKIFGEFLDWYYTHICNSLEVSPTEN